MKKLLLSISMLFALTACELNTGYKVSRYGTDRVVEGTIISKREVRVNVNDDTGSIVGGIAGAIVGSEFGNNSPAGAVIGALAGSQLSRNSGVKIAYEYIIRRKNKKLLAIVVNDPSFLKGDKVYVILGKHPKLKLRR